MKPSAAIAALDRQIRAHGETITIRRGGEEQQLRAFVRGYRPDELVGGIEQGDVGIIVSPTALAGGPFAADLPERPDQIEIGGRNHTVQSVEPVRLADVLVRINILARG